MTTSRLRKLLCAMILGISMVAASTVLATDVQPGHDLFVTRAGTEYDFAGNFGLGLVPLQGNPFGNFDFGSGPVGVDDVDTIVRRLSTATQASPTIPIEIVALELVSVSPVDIGNGPEDLFVSFNSMVSGQMTINGIGTDGDPHGTFDSNMTFNFDVSGSTSGFLGTIQDSLTQSGAPWRHLPVQGIPIINGVNHFLNGTGAENDFWPTDLVQEAHPGVGVHVAGAGVLPNVIPTVSEWGMIVMALLGTALATVAIRRQSLVVAGAGGSRLGDRSVAFDRDLFAKTLLGVLTLVVALAVAAAVLGVDLMARDLAGLLLSGSIAAYVLHLWIAQARERRGDR
ncbi:MAG: IPTL-CTERM sorting domain-containing protein [Myxococcota bacterium]